MNIIIQILVILIVSWCTVYTMSFGIYLLKENKSGGIATIAVAVITFFIPLIILFIKI